MPTGFKVVPRECHFNEQIQSGSGGISIVMGAARQVAPAVPTKGKLATETGLWGPFADGDCRWREARRLLRPRRRRAELRQQPLNHPASKVAAGAAKTGYCSPGAPVSFHLFCSSSASSQTIVSWIAFACWALELIVSVLAPRMLASKTKRMIERVLCRRSRRRRRPAWNYRNLEGPKKQQPAGRPTGIDSEQRKSISD